MIWIAYDGTLFYLGYKAGTLFDDGIPPVILGIIVTLCGKLMTYIGNVITGLLIVIREWKHIHCPNYFKLAFYLITWPIHDMLYPFICFASLFMRVTWKPIKHDVVKTLDDIDKK